MNKKARYTGLAAGLVQLLAGGLFIYLLLVFWGSGAMLGFAGSKGIIMLMVFLGVLWILTRGRKK